MSFEQGGITFYEPSDLSIVSWNDNLYMRIENRTTNQAFHVKLEDITAKFALAGHITHNTSTLAANNGENLTVRNDDNSAGISLFDSGKLWIQTGSGVGKLRLSNTGKLEITAPQGVWVNGIQLTVP